MSMLQWFENHCIKEYKMVAFLQRELLFGYSWNPVLRKVSFFLQALNIRSQSRPLQPWRSGKDQMGPAHPQAPASFPG